MTPAEGPLGAKRNRHGSAERLAEQNNAACRIARRGEFISGARIADQAVFGRPAARAAEAAITKRQQAGAAGGEPSESVGARFTAIGVAQEIQHQLLAIAWRDVPGEQGFAVVAAERYFAGLRQAGSRRRHAAGIEEIEQRTLKNIHRRQQAAITQDGGDQEPFQGGHGSLITRADLARSYRSAVEHKKAQCVGFQTGTMGDFSVLSAFSTR